VKVEDKEKFRPAAVRPKRHWRCQWRSRSRRWRTEHGLEQSL